ncbi:MAG: ATP-binding protein [Chloroflexi bacterium]|nr:ATP-binding protein [Chloroflexota bacterium]
MGRTIEIVREARMENVAELRDFVWEAARREGADEEACFDLKLAVDEACTNIVEHGYAGLPPGPIVVTFQREADRLIVTIRDHARPFDPEAVPPPDLESDWPERPVRGLGWHLIRRTMDEVSLASDGERGNRLTLVKSCNPIKQETRSTKET